MTKMFTDSGLLNEYGKETFDQFLGKEVDTLLNSCSTVEELRLMKAILAKYIGDKVADRLHKKLVEAAAPPVPDLVDRMNEFEFIAYILKKYAPACINDDYSAMAPKEKERYSKIINDMRETIRRAVSIEFVQPAYPTSTPDRKVF